MPPESARGADRSVGRQHSASPHHGPGAGRGKGCPALEYWNNGCRTDAAARGDRYGALRRWGYGCDTVRCGAGWRPFCKKAWRKICIATAAGNLPDAQNLRHTGCAREKMRHPPPERAGRRMPRYGARGVDRSAAARGTDAIRCAAAQSSGLFAKRPGEKPSTPPRRGKRPT